MIKVIIAEDEMLVRIGLKHSIDWNTLGMEVVADVDNGQSAYQCFLEKRPQIVITDLKMPKMGGVELIQKIREIDQECIIIVISCVEDFEIVRGMIAYNIFDYLSKALMNMKQMNDVLQKAKNTLCNQYQKLQVIEEEYIEDTLEKSLIEYLIEEKLIVEEFVQSTKEPGIPYIAIMVNKSFLNDCKNIRQNIRRNSTLKDLLKNSLMHVRGQVYTLSDELDIIFIEEKDITNHEMLEKDLLHIVHTSKELLKVDLKIVITHLAEGWGQLQEKYKKNKVLAKQFYFLETPLIWEFNTFKIESYIQKLLQPIQQESLEWMLADSQKEYYNQIIKNIVADCADENNTDYKQLIQDKIICLANLINNTTKTNTTEEMIQLQREIINTYTLVDTLDVYRGFVEKVKETMREHFPKKDEIVKALHYIEKNYNKDIGLKGVAGYVNLSPNYFSTLFKKEMGQSFVDYMMYLKIEKAKELLKTNMLFYQIAEEVGFAEETYFSKMFKLKTGLSPREWKLNLERKI